VLLLSTDPAHSLGDVLEMELSDQETPVAGLPDLPNLAARELDAPAAFGRLEERYREAVERAFSGLSRGARGVDAPLDRAVVERLFEATPPGLDELVALSELTDLTASTDEGDDRQLVIVDTAPTGHALRLLELPEIALTWDHALLSILLEYRDAVGLPEGLARELVDLSKSLKRLRALLTDPERSGFAVVTRAGELPLRETRRLLASLDSLGTAVPAVIVNAVPDGDCARCRRRPEPAAEPGWPAILTAPAEYPPPRGPRALESWAHRWRRRERA
jgi:arsenite-transporting ATPase